MKKGRSRKKLVSAKIGKPNDSVIMKPVINTIRSPQGVASITRTRMRFANVENFVFDMGPIAWLFLSNSLYQPSSNGTSFVLPNYSYFEAWANFYNFYRVSASKFSVTATVNIESGTNSFPMAIVVIPFSVDPTETGVVPLTLRDALVYPMAKIMYLDQASGTSQRKLDYYLNFKALLDSEDYMGPGTGANMPSTPNGGVASQPSQLTYWYLCGFLTNGEVDGQDVSVDLDITMEAYTTMWSVVQEVDEERRGLHASAAWKADHPDWKSAHFLEPGAPEQHDNPPLPLKIDYTAKLQQYRKDIKALAGPAKEDEELTVEQMRALLAKKAPPDYVEVKYPKQK